MRFMDVKTHSTLCLLPWVSVSIGTLGQVLRCQMSREPMGHLSQDRLKDIINNEKFLNLRKNMYDGVWDEEKSPLLPGCSPCKLREDAGVTSKRKHWRTVGSFADLWKKDIFEQQKINQIYHLDLAFSNTCNFKCRMCNSAFSTKWSKDEEELKKRGFEITNRKQHLPAMNSSETLLQLRGILPNLQQLRKLEIVGGEPFLNSELFDFVGDLRREGIWKNVDVMITTNGSLISEELLEKLSGSLKMNLNISVDGTGPIFEYSRAAGACTWQQLEKNISIAKSFCKKQNSLKDSKTFWKINLNGAFQIYNMLNLYDFIEWVLTTLQIDKSNCRLRAGQRHSFEHRLLLFPKHLSSQIAPLEVKAAAKKQLERLISSFPFIVDMYEYRYIKDILIFLEKEAEERHQQYWSQFVHYTQELDRIRSENFYSAAPWLKDYIV